MGSRYRWVALALTMLVNIPVQTLWIGYSSITPQAARYYGVGDFSVVLLSMLFMAVYVLVSIPASWFIDTRGVRAAVGTGALLVGICGLVRGLAGTSYPLVLVATVGIALGQPLLLNAWTSMPAGWFPPRERAGAVGMTTVSNLAGIALGLVLSPILLERMEIGRMQTLYGAIALAVGALYVAFYRDHAPAPDDTDGKALVLDGMKHAFSMGSFRLMLTCSLLCMGVFNGLTSLTAEIIAPHGLGATEAGNVGTALLVGGVLGAAVLPHVSDRLGRRVPFIGIGMIGGGISVALLAVASSAAVIYAIAAVIGAFLVPLLPIGMEYAAELVRPTPDGTSNGIVQIAGQASVVVIGLMWLARGPGTSFTYALLGLGLMLAAGGLHALLRLPELHGGRVARRPETADVTEDAAAR